MVIAGIAWAAATGCTMCPDPFDYSGPVPNGSSPQNDFRARSNGIRPLLAAPHPWPAVVEAGSPPMPVASDEGTSTVLVASGAAAADGGDSVVPVVNTAVDQPADLAEPGVVPGDSLPADDDTAAAAPARPAAVAVPAAAESAATQTATAAGAGVEGSRAATAIAGAATAPPADGETPGWRRRGPRRFE